MSRAAASDPMALADALTRHANRLAEGLEAGTGELLDRVTPVTAGLLRWWFGPDACQSRTHNFHAGQRQAILNVIVAHEVLASPDLPDLYRQTGADDSLDSQRRAQIARDSHAHPKYCLKMATGTGKTWVLQALLVWQMLNRTAAMDQGRDDTRYSRRFLIVAPGLIVYERLLDALVGKRDRDERRDFATADLVRYAGLFVPPTQRERVHQFLRGNVCTRHQIGHQATGNGMVAITNWHLLGEAGDTLAAWERLDDPHAPADPATVVHQLLPLTPGRSNGNRLEALDRRWSRGNVLSYLAGLPDLVVFNDEAHHIHDLKTAGESSEVEWQKSLNRIAQGKGRRFVQIDFSATPYNDIGSGRHRGKVYFPHIVADFDLRQAIRQGLVKSLVLDRRRELDALPLEYKAERDASGNVALGEGQRVMLRAGLQKLRTLERDFAAIDPQRRPKMLVVCEDTRVSPLVARFLQHEGLHEDDVLTVDSGRKAELGDREWEPLRQRLFDIDRHAQPRVIVSVLMLREGFDVDNICVIVPLRSSRAQILLEQTIGRGLRLMWREPEYTGIKRENRERIQRGEQPQSLIDVLSIIEHPAFESFYDGLMAEGLVGTTGGDDGRASTGDLLVAGLRDDYEQYDYAVPFIVKEADEKLDRPPIDITALPPFTAMSRRELERLVDAGATVTSADLMSSALFGDCRVGGAVMEIGGYNELLSRLTRRIAQAPGQPLPKGVHPIAQHLPRPFLQLDTVGLATALDDYVRARLFDEPFDPFADRRWRLLLCDRVVEHVCAVFGPSLVDAHSRATVSAAEVQHRRLSEVSRLMVRESASQPVEKCIYTRLAWPSRDGALVRSMIRWAQADASIEAFCRLSESHHDFVRFHYLRGNGQSASCFPDFIMRTDTRIYMVESGTRHVSHPDTQRKLRAAAIRCERINALPPHERSQRSWHFVLLDETLFRDWQCNGARLADLLAFSEARFDAAVPVPGAWSQPSR